MTGKTIKNKILVENDIEKNREDGNWNRVIELADMIIKPKPPLHNFLVGEAKLESYLEQNPPFEKNISKARIGLIEPKNHLLEAITEEGDKCGVALDGHLLLGKVQYALGDYEGALKHFIEADLQGLTEKSLAPRSIRIIAESFAIKGLCLEKITPQSSSKYALAEWIEQIKHCYETASDLGLLYLQQQSNKQHSLNVLTSTVGGGSHSPQPSTHQQTHLSPLIETAILRAPVFLIEHGKLLDAITFYRNMLSAVEASGAHAIRLILCRQLAELLLRGIAALVYSPPTDNKKAVTSPWKPSKYTGINLFCPRNQFEEIVLLLLISEAMAARNAVLSQSPEFKEARLRAFSNATAIYDLLTVALIRWRQFSLLQESFDRAMKFSSDEAHIWMQHALCLDAIGQHSRALAMMKEVIRLLKDETQPRLIAARIAYHSLNKVDEGLHWSQEALVCEQKNPHHLLSRCYLYIGIGAHCKAYSIHVKSARDRFNSMAYESFLRAYQLDANDHLSKFYLGLHAAYQCQINTAVSHIKVALNLCPEHLPSLHLMILLLTAQKQMKEASELLDSTLQDYPDNILLHFLKIHLELHAQNNETALMLGKRMLSVWRTSSKSQICSDNSNGRLLHLQEFSDKESNSLHAPQSLIVAKVEQAISEVAASSISSSLQRPSCADNSWTMQHKIWLLLAEIYLEQDQIDSASSCLQEAVNIFPLSHHIMFMKGRIQEYKNEFVEAKQSYQNAISINPCHIKSLQHLGLMYHYLGNQKLAEKILRFAAKLDPWSSQTWYNLGTVLESVGEAQSATDCLATALHTETISPVIPFSVIPITFE